GHSADAPDDADLAAARSRGERGLRGTGRVPGNPWPGRLFLPDRWPGRQPHGPVLYQRWLPPGPFVGTGGQAAGRRLPPAGGAPPLAGPVVLVRGRGGR